MISMRWLSFLGQRRTQMTSSVSSSTRDPFGPDFEQRLEKLALLSRKLEKRRQRMERIQKQRGMGIEFADHRDYQPGDDPRLIDWNATERLEKLLLRVNEEHKDRITFVLLDESASMGWPFFDTFERGQQLTAALSYLALRHFDQVVVGAFHDDVLSFEPLGRGAGRILRILRFLRDRQPKGGTHLESIARKFVTRNSHPGVLYLVSDAYDHAGVERALDSLRYARHVVHFVHVIAPNIIAPNIIAPNITAFEERGDITLVDSETGEELDVTLSPTIAKQIEQTALERSTHLERACRLRGIYYHRAPISENFEHIVIQILRASSAGFATSSES
jgi:uncharacterized protein (DUF58 family)